MSIIDRDVDLELTAAAAPAADAAPSRRPPVMRTVHDRSQSAARARLRRLRAVVLLDGSVRKTALSDAIGRSLLELPVEHGRNLFDLWRSDVRALILELGLDTLPTRVIVGQTSVPPVVREQDRAACVTVEPDPSELRGTGGVLRDLAADFEDDDLLLVANAAQVLVEPLARIALSAAERGGDVTIVANEDGTPASVALVSRRALRELPPVGFIDLKEQGLPLMARRHDVRVQYRARPAGLPIRTPQDYLAALKAYHRMQAGEPPHNAPFSERWRRRFAVAEPGATVADDAELHNTVVLRGGRVESGALVANSIVCAGGIVRRHEQVIERLVEASGRKPVKQNC